MSKALRCRLHWHRWETLENADGGEYDRCVRCQVDRGTYTIDPRVTGAEGSFNLEREGAIDVARMVFPGRKKSPPAR